MAIMLYTAGDEVEVRGIKCCLLRTEMRSLEHYLANGYVKSPEELYSDPELNVTDQDEPKESNICKLSNPEIRQAAKEMGLDKWDTARFDKLKEALGYDG